MSLRAKRDSKDMNNNDVYTQIGQFKTFQTLGSFTFWDEDGTEYSLKALLEKILEQEKEIKALQSELERVNNNHTNALKAYQSTNDKATSLIVKAADLMSNQIANLSKDVEEIKSKIKFLK